MPGAWLPSQSRAARSDQELFIISGLTADTEYEVEAADNAQFTDAETVRTSTLSPVAPQLQIQSVLLNGSPLIITRNGADLTAIINPTVTSGSAAITVRPAAAGGTITISPTSPQTWTLSAGTPSQTLSWAVTLTYQNVSRAYTVSITWVLAYPSKPTGLSATSIWTPTSTGAPVGNPPVRVVLAATLSRTLQCDRVAGVLRYQWQYSVTGTFVGVLEQYGSHQITLPPVRSTISSSEYRNPVTAYIRVRGYGAVVSGIGTLIGPWSDAQRITIPAYPRTTSGQ